MSRVADEQALEDALRHTLVTVAQATRVHRDPLWSYLEPNESAPRRRYAATAAVAGLAAAAAVAILMAAPQESATPVAGSGTHEPTSSTTASTSPPASGPQGSRLLDEGLFAGKRWAIYGLDEAEFSEETPCVQVSIEGVIPATQGCGYPGQAAGPPSDTDVGAALDTSGSGVPVHQVGPLAERDGEILVFGVVDRRIAAVVVMPGQSGQTNEGALQVDAVADPAYPEGARYFVVVVRKANDAASTGASAGTSNRARIRYIDNAGREMYSSEVALDGPVGG